jgi:hypothetical protein
MKTALEVGLNVLLVGCGMLFAAAMMVQVDQHLLQAGINIAEWSGVRLIAFFVLWVAVPTLGMWILHRFTTLFR